MKQTQTNQTLPALDRSKALDKELSDLRRDIRSLRKSAYQQVEIAARHFRTVCTDLREAVMCVLYLLWWMGKALSVGLRRYLASRQ